MPAVKRPRWWRSKRAWFLITAALVAAGLLEYFIIHGTYEAQIALVKPPGWCLGIVECEQANDKLRTFAIRQTWRSAILWPICTIGLICSVRAIQRSWNKKRWLAMMNIGTATFLLGLLTYFYVVPGMFFHTPQ